MKHKGKAAAAFRRIMLIAFVVTIVLVLMAGGITTFAGKNLNAAIMGAIVVPFVLFGMFTAYFFRDPDAQVPAGGGLIVAPAHGKVDVIDETEEPLVMGGRCKRVSIFLSVFDVHVQQAPVAGKVTLVRHNPGQFLNALKLESAALNENVVMGFEATDPACGRVAIKLITGLIARRIVPWAVEGDIVAKGERVGLIQFGSRVDIYLPAGAKVAVRLGDKVVGGETVVARL